MSEMESLRRFYGVPARRGGRVAFTYQGRREATILSARDHKLWLRFDGDTKRSGPFHPTWEIEYLGEGRKIDPTKRWSAEDRGHTTPCWIWQGPIDRTGYGRVSPHQGAHRVVYEALIGPIPAGLQIDHLCRVRCCVNPEHMEPVTSAENTRRGIWPSSLKTHCVNGHEYTPENTYIRPSHKRSGKRGCRRCNAEASRAYAARKRAV